MWPAVAWRGIGVGPWTGWVDRPLACPAPGEGKVDFWGDFPRWAATWPRTPDDVPWALTGTTQCLKEYVRGRCQLSGSPGASGFAEILRALSPPPRATWPGRVGCKPLHDPGTSLPTRADPTKPHSTHPRNINQLFAASGAPGSAFPWAIMGPGSKTGRNDRMEGWGR